MKVKTFAVTVAASAAAMGTIGAASSMAATLYTTKAHTTAGGGRHDGGRQVRRGVAVQRLRRR